MAPVFWCRWFFTRSAALGVRVMAMSLLYRACPQGRAQGVFQQQGRIALGWRQLQLFREVQSAEAGGLLAGLPYDTFTQHRAERDGGRAAIHPVPAGLHAAIRELQFQADL